MRAGGLGEWADKEKIKLFRAKGGMTLVNYTDIQQNGKMGDDPLLEQGDKIFVDKKWFRIKD